MKTEIIEEQEEEEEILRPPRKRRRRTKIVSKSKVFQCEDCEFKTEDRNVFVNHYVEEHDRYKLNCEDCDFVTADASEIATHQFRMHEKRDEIGKKRKLRFNCRNCEFAGDSLDKIKVHEATEHKSRNPEVVLACNKCDDFTAERISDMSKHVEKQHGSNAFKADDLDFVETTYGHFKCNICDFTTESKGGISSHVRSAHGKLALNAANEAFAYRYADVICMQ